jgi:hypothetical protein
MGPRASLATMAGERNQIAMLAAKIGALTASPRVKVLELIIMTPEMELRPAMKRLVRHNPVKRQRRPGLGARWEKEPRRTSVGPQRGGRPRVERMEAGAEPSLRRSEVARAGRQRVLRAVGACYA